VRNAAAMGRFDGNRLTSGAAPKSSAVTINRFKQCRAASQEAEELHTLA